MTRTARRRAAGRAALAAVLLSCAAAVGAQTPVERGAYLAVAGGCVTCHTEDREGAAPFAGGRPLVTAFGTFYAPNITPDNDTGIGRWTDAQFLTGLHEGESPTGDVYYAAFPFTSYTGMTDEDVLAIKAWLFTQPAVRQANKPHELSWFLRPRLAARTWRILYFTPQRFVPDEGKTAEWNRGAYLVRHLGHCGECHTPRGKIMGALLPGEELAGNPDGAEDRAVPNITPHDENGIGEWSLSDLETYLEIGMLPDGDFAGAGMGEVIDENTSKLTAEDRHAIATYLKSVPARAGQKKAAEPASEKEESEF